MAFGIYVHYPYCIQKCHYCDFITAPTSHKISPENYALALKNEITSRQQKISLRQITSLYFGGGTPSLAPQQDILMVFEQLNKCGFEVMPGAEITIEINPGTITDKSLDFYVKTGVNRFSVGVQTFHASHLAHTRREHSVKDTETTLRRLREFNVSVSLDLLYGLPNQSASDLQMDLDRFLEYSPDHISPYLLTVPNNHPMSQGRPLDGEQAEMFSKVKASLEAAGYLHYELSNFAKPGKESKHNLLYWSDGAYWGIGASSHSYDPNHGPWGLRYWNAFNLESYVQQSTAPELPTKQLEALKLHESLTDFLHTHLRVLSGFRLQQLLKKFPPKVVDNVQNRLQILEKTGLIEVSKPEIGWRLTKAGQLLSNKVFLALTYDQNEIKALVSC